MAKQTSLKNKLFVSKVSKTTSVGNSHRAIIPNELLTRLKITMGDQLVWKLEDGRKISVWKRTKRDKVADGSTKIIDIKETAATATSVKVVNPDMSTQVAETQPQITSTNHI